MVWNVYAAFFNTVERDREREQYKNAHETLYRNGFKYQISFYGRCLVPYDGKHEQARIEICSESMFTKDAIRYLYKLFSHFQANREYSLFLFRDPVMVEVKAF